MTLEDRIDAAAIRAKLEIRERTNEAMREAFTKLGCTDAQATHLIRSCAQRRRHERHRKEK